MDLSYVFWLGGAPCSGKSSVASILAESYGLHLYSIDEQFNAHLSRLNAEDHPTMTRWTSTPWDALWMQSRQELLAQAIAAYTEHFSLVLQDMEALPLEPLLVEGNPCMPGLVASLAVSPGHVLYLLPGESFLRERYAQRGSWVQGILSQCRNPEVGFENWMQREVDFTAFIHAEAQAYGFRSIVIDGSQAPKEVASLIAHHFGLGE